MTAVLETATLIDIPPATAPAAAPKPERPVESGLRATTDQDHVRAAGWGITSGVASAAVASATLPVQYLALAFVLGAGLGVLGYLDQVTQLIRNWHTAVFAAAAAILIGATQVSLGGDVILPAIGMAGASFAFLLVFALVMRGGFVGGGDIKLAPVPAALLGAISPLAALLWLQATFICALLGMITLRLAGNRDKHMAMAPYMAVAVLPAIAAHGLLAPTLGL